MSDEAHYIDTENKPLSIFYDELHRALNAQHLLLDPGTCFYIIVSLNSKTKSQFDVAKDYRGILFRGYSCLEREKAMKDIGEDILATCFLWPRLLAHDMPNLSYYVEVGRTAFKSLSGDDLKYHEIAYNMDPLAKVLQEMGTRLLVHDPKKLLDLWIRTREHHLARLLKEKGLPILIQ